MTALKHITQWLSLYSFTQKFKNRCILLRSLTFCILLVNAATAGSRNSTYPDKKSEIPKHYWDTQAIGDMGNTDNSTLSIGYNIATSTHVRSRLAIEQSAYIDVTDSSDDINNKTGISFELASVRERHSSGIGFRVLADHGKTDSKKHKNSYLTGPYLFRDRQLCKRTYAGLGVSASYSTQDPDGGTKSNQKVIAGIIARAGYRMGKNV